ncbi:MAG: DUF3185 family protein [Pseudohongiellaceae bacterium]
MSNRKIFGFVLLAAGIVLLYFGWQSSQSAGDQVTEAITGQFTDNTMWLIIGGIASAVAGAFLALGRR